MDICTYTHMIWTPINQEITGGFGAAQVQCCCSRKWRWLKRHSGAIRRWGTSNEKPRDVYGLKAS